MPPDHSLPSELERQVQARTAELRASEERFRLMVEGTKDYAIFMLDPHGKMISWNRGAERIKQYHEREILGKHFSIFYPPEDLQAGKPERELRIASAEGKYEEEGWRVRKDGSQFWASVLITALFTETGELRGFAKVTRDITAKRQAEKQAQRLLEEAAARRAAQANAEALRVQHEQLRITLESIGDGVIVTDAAGCVDLINPVAQALTGWSQAEAVGKPLTQVFHIINEYSRQNVDNPVGRVLREGVVVGLANSTVLVARNGSERPIDDTAAPIRDSQQRIRGVVLVFHDVSEKRKAQNELKKSEKALREADRRKDEFLAMLAHELRNPLAPLRNALQILRMRNADGVTQESAREIMERQLEYLVRLVDDLLDVSRIMRGKIELRTEEVELRHVIERAVETAQPVLDAQGHELQLELPEQPVWLQADSIRLSQVVTNLIQNAAKFTEHAGRIRLTAALEGEEVVLRVKDQGIGIAPELLPRVFDLFVQGDRSIARTQGGLGIGLSLVRRLVEMHHGSVQALSEGPGKGSEFVVRLPVRQGRPEGPEIAEEQTGAAAPADRLRVLVVDDSADAVESMAILLRLLHHDVRVAHDGPSALEAARAYRPDVILLDIGLPGMSGYEVAQRLRQRPEFTRTLIVAMTGYGQDDDRARSRQAGFDHHLTKPADPDVIGKLLQSVRRDP